MKDKLHAQIASLTQTRDTLVKQRTALKNKVNNILSAHGINLPKEAISGEKACQEMLGMKFDPMVEVELRVIVGQIRGLEREHRPIGQDDQKRGIETGRPRKPEKHQGDRRPGGDGAACR